MPRSSLSQQDRNRFEQLLQGPLVKPVPSPQDRGAQDAKEASRLAGINRHAVTRYGGWTAGIIAVASLVILMVAVKLGGRGQGSSIQLQAQDKKGQLQIRWNADSDAIRRAVSAKLYIIDGSERLFVKLDDGRLRLGNVSYTRSSGRVELRMELAQPDGKLVEDQATFVGTRPSTTNEFALETSNGPVGMPRAAASRLAARSAQPAEIAGVTAPSSHRERKKLMEQSGARLPFTCSNGDTFRVTDAPAGWDIFRCHGKNVWSLVPAQTRDDRPPARTPGSKATTLTAKPDQAPTT
jgi:hypothetical protein